ncbi:hypothetical protein ABTB34_21305, partial [Acinetobacter baumannii]
MATAPAHFKGLSRIGRKRCRGNVAGDDSRGGSSRTIIAAQPSIVATPPRHDAARKPAMLNLLKISQFAIVENLELEFS